MIGGEAQLRPASLSPALAPISRSVTSPRLSQALRVGRRRVVALAAAFKASGRAGTRNDPVVGAVWITVAMASLAGLGVLGRYSALSGLDPLQVMFFRNLFCVVWLLPLLAWRGLSLATTDQPRLYALRVAVSFISMMSMFQAFALIPVGEVTAISFLSPIFGTLFAIFLLGERVHVRRWTALAVGLLGALIILRPTRANLGAGQLFALVSAFSLGIIGPLVKQLSAKDDADRVVFITNVALTVLSFVPALLAWRWPAAELWPYLAGLGLVAVIGHLALVRGYQSMDASLAMTFKFSRLPFAVLLGYLAFGESIDLATWIGAFIIVAAAAYIARREARLKGKATKAEAGVGTF